MMMKATQPSDNLYFPNHTNSHPMPSSTSSSSTGWGNEDDALAALNSPSSTQALDNNMDPYQGGTVDSFASFFYSSFNSTSDGQEDFIFGEEEDELARFVTTDPPSPASSIQAFHNNVDPHQGGGHVDSFTSFF
jgi:hypothetical protein